MKILRFYFFFALSVGWLTLGCAVAQAASVCVIWVMHPAQTAAPTARAFTFLSAAGTVGPGYYPLIKSNPFTPRPPCSAWYVGTNKTVYRTWYTNLMNL